MSAKEPKRYGLIIKKKPNSAILSKPSIFGDDNSSDEEVQGRQTVNKTIKKEAEKNKQMRQTQIEIGKVLEEDPTAYDYDKVYDKMTEKKMDLLAAKSTDVVKKPKYIGNLMKYAEVRKNEEERRVERQVQKERENEGKEFADKEAFVTSAYRKKMEDLAEDEERQRKLDELEGDVTKQADLSKFYRNLLEKNVSTGGAYNTSDETNKKSSATPSDDKLIKDIEKKKSEGDRGTPEDSDGRDRKNRGHKGIEEHKSRHTKGHRAKKGSERRREKSESKRDDSEKSGSGVERRDGSRVDEKRRVMSSDNEEAGHRTPDDGEKRDRSRSDRHRRDVARDDEERRDVSTDNEKRREGSSDGKERVVKMAKGHEEAEDTKGQKGTKGDKSSSREEDNKMETSKDEEGPKESLSKIKHKREEQREELMTSKLAKHSTKESVLSAKERYLARKKARVVVKPSSDEDD